MENVYRVTCKDATKKQVVKHVVAESMTAMEKLIPEDLTVHDFKLIAEDVITGAAKTK
ncbi:unnamed protein product [marine sediment metagenome]|uniref:Uncharacterized protein n=1 Tax=marine sediment metagenome TaxID=412755 RepID=X1AWP4_9ZZZZ